MNNLSIKKKLLLLVSAPVLIVLIYMGFLIKYSLTNLTKFETQIELAEKNSNVLKISESIFNFSYALLEAYSTDGLIESDLNSIEIEKNLKNNFSDYQSDKIIVPLNYVNNKIKNSKEIDKYFSIYIEYLILLKNHTAELFLEKEINRNENIAGDTLRSLFHFKSLFLQYVSILVADTKEGRRLTEIQIRELIRLKSQIDEGFRFLEIAFNNANNQEQSTFRDDNFLQKLDSIHLNIVSSGKIEKESKKNLTLDLKKILIELNRFSKELNRDFYNDSLILRDLEKNTLVFYTIVQLLMILIVLYASTFISKDINRSFDKLKDNFTQLANGNFSLNIEDDSRKDEIGKIMRALKQMAKNLNELQEKEKKLLEQVSHSEKLASIGELSAGVAHEINNPLTIIQGNATLLLDGLLKENQNEKIKKSLRKIDEACVRISKITKNMTSISRSNSNSIQVFDLVENMKSNLDFVEEMYSKNYISLILECDIAEGYVKGDEGKFQQIIINLLNNAKDAIKECKELGTITIKIVEINKNIHISIRDDGVGIEEDKVQRIFNAFYTTKPIGKGTGLGLHLTYQIIKEMNGEIEVSSQYGNGTEFKLILPIHESLTISEPSFYDKSKRFKILIVDDETDIRQLIENYLSDYAEKIYLASNGIEAMEIIENNKLDVVFTDLSMPECDGVELLKKLKKMNYFGKKVVVTGGAKNIEINAEIDELCDHIITKPILQAEIIEVLLVKNKIAS